LHQDATPPELLLGTSNIRLCCIRAWSDVPDESRGTTRLRWLAGAMDEVDLAVRCLKVIAGDIPVPEALVFAGHLPRR
jgi:hypothetical protein